MSYLRQIESMTNPHSDKQVDSIIRSIIEKRNRLGWSNKRLAEESNVPYSAIIRMQKGIGYWEDYALQIDSRLDEAIQSLSIMEKEQITEIKKSITTISNKDPKNSKPAKKRCVWAIKHSQCIKCGSSLRKHIARGLCKSCYDKDIEKRHKNLERIHGGSSQLLTAEYLSRIT